MDERQASQLNPWLSGDLRQDNPNKGGPDTIQDPRRPSNVVWQNRDHIPDDYENALADALEKIFASGTTELGEIVKKLNDSGPRSEDGPWTEELFQAEMKRLGDLQKPKE